MTLVRWIEPSVGSAFRRSARAPDGLRNVRDVQALRTLFSMVRGLVLSPRIWTMISPQGPAAVAGFQWEISYIYDVELCILQGLTLNVRRSRRRQQGAGGRHLVLCRAAVRLRRVRELRACGGRDQGAPDPQLEPRRGRAAARPARVGSERGSGRGFRGTGFPRRPRPHRRTAADADAAREGQALRGAARPDEPALSEQELVHG